MILRRNLNASILDALFFSLMVGLGESYFGAFAVASGFGELVAGLATTLPLIGGGGLQLFTPLGVKFFGSYRRWVVCGAVLQGFCFVPFAYCAFRGGISEWLFFFVATLYWTFLLGTVPAWNAWLHSLVPRRLRTKYFSKRNFLGHSATLLALIISGLALELGKINGNSLWVFALLFLVSFVFRLISSYFLWRQSETPQLVGQLKIISLKKVFGNFIHERYGKILLFVLLFKMGVYFATPFFTPYMLKDLKMNYWVYMLILSASLVGKMGITQLIARYSKGINAEKMLLISSWGIVFIPIFWTFSRSWIYLVPLEVCSGLLWGSFELGLFLTLFDNIPEEEQTSVLTSFNFLHMIAILLGTALGALTFQSLALHPYRYMIVFIFSGALRFFCLPLFPGVWQKTKMQPAFNFLVRPLAMLLSFGLLGKFIVFFKTIKLRNN